MIWVNYNDLTVLPHWESWLVKEIIPKWAQDSGLWIIKICPDGLNEWKIARGKIWMEIFVRIPSNIVFGKRLFKFKPSTVISWWFTTQQIWLKH